MSIPYLPSNAPFNEAQRAWLNGYLAALFSDADSSNAGSSQASPEAPAKAPVTILYGSQTGNAEGLAKQARKAAEARGHKVTLSELNGYADVKLAEVRNLLVITSTYGEGDPPDNAQEFHRFILDDGAPKLSQTRFSVLGLGDTNYADFCQTAKDLDRRFEELGGARIYPRVECETDYDEPADAWLSAALAALDGEDRDPVVRPSTPGGKGMAGVNGTSVKGVSPYSKKNPYQSKLVENPLLNLPGSAKATHHVVFALNDPDLSYEVGDALGVFPVNHPEAVTEILAITELSGDASVVLDDGTETSLEEALSHHLDITKLNKVAVANLAEKMALEELRNLCADPEAWKQFSWGRELIDVLLLCRPRFSDASELVATLKPLAPRLYSISSSPKAHPGEVHLTVGRVSYESHGRGRSGVCSRYLAEMKPGDSAGVYVQRNPHFRPPVDPETPMIMVGPGTGIAPFRAFLEERQATGASGRNWLFFGDQRSATDFLYQQQLEAFRRDGVLTRLDTAFSRDQASKVYVQHRMLEAGKALFAWLQEGGACYVCGDASRMAKDVESSLLQIISEHGGMDKDGAEAYLKQLKQESRYLRDVY